MTKAAIIVHLTHENSEAYAIASRNWPFAELPVIGSQVYGLGLDEAIDYCVVTEVNFRMSDDTGSQAISICADRCEPKAFEYRDQLDAACSILRELGWRIDAADGPLRGWKWRQEGDSA